MREILYRAKRLADGKWIYGYYFEQDMPDGKRSYIRTLQTDRFGTDFSVDPATVGEYTGLQDKNGNKIFEGDIINIETYGNLAINAGFEHNEALQLSYNDCRGRLLGQWYSEVVYKECAFLVGDDFLCEFADDPRITYPYFELCVCGNINDNPDMLKGRTQIGEIPLTTIVMKGGEK